MKAGPAGSFGAQLKALRETAGYTQEELATIAGLSVHGVSALERGERRRPHLDTVRALSAALELADPAREALLLSARSHVVQEVDNLSLPVSLTTLLGREAELQTLREWLADPSVRLITLTGPGGAGKTRLALDLARETSRMGSARVVFVSLALIHDPAFVASAIAEALGMTDVTAVELPRRAHAACRDAVLLVLDNFEQVSSAAPLIADLLAWVSPLRVLATSRAPLRLRGEREYGIGPLLLEAGSETLPLADLARAPAVRLFVERVRDVQPGFRLSAANGRTVVRICRKLDGLPLALELAAPWMKVLTPDDLLRRLEKDGLLSSVGPRDLPERQQTMNATVAWSYQLLGPNEQRAFRRLGALPCRFRLDAAAAVLSDCGGPPIAIEQVLEAAAALIDKSLLLRAETSTSVRPAYRMLETVRAYAGMELAAAGERDDAMEGVVRYCLDEASSAAHGLIGPAQVKWLNRVREDLESYRVALAWLIERGRADEAAAIAWGLKYFWLIRGHPLEGLQWYQRVLELPGILAAAESKALLGAAGMWWTQGALDRARPALGRALTLAQSIGDVETMAHAEHVFGHVEHALGHEDTAREMFAHSIERFRAQRIASGTGNALSGMAVLALAEGNAAEAERLLDEATAVLQHAGPWFLTWALYVRAILAVRRGNADQAIAVARESLMRIRELHDKFAFVYALVPLAAAAVLKGHHAWAARILGARDAVTERTGVTVSDKSVQDLRAHAKREARAHLGPERWARAYAAGGTASIDAVLKDIEGVLRKDRRADRPS